VPWENLIGVENKGFIGIMLNFNQERLGMAAGACGYAKVLPRRGDCLCPGTAHFWQAAGR